MPQRSRFAWGWSPHLFAFVRTDWVAAGARRVFLWAGELFLLGILVAGSAMIFLPFLVEPPAEPPIAEAKRTSIEPVDGVAFSPDSKTLASCGWDQEGVRIWDLTRLSDGRPSDPVLLPRASAAYAVAFSADGTLLAAAGRKSLSMWSCAAGRYTLFLEEQIETSHCLAYSPDGQTLAIGGDDGAIRLWDMPGGRERAILRGHVGVVRSLDFSADSRRLVSTDESRTIMLMGCDRGYRHSAASRRSRHEQSRDLRRLRDRWPACRGG